MVVNISEHLLSSPAQKLLKNTKNKSQLIRDAIELYATRDISCDSELKNEVKKIKEMLKDLLNENSQAEFKSVQKHQESLNNNIRVPTEENIPNKVTNTQNKEQKEKIQEPNIVVEANNGLSEEKKREIAKMLDMSIDSM